MSVTVQRQLQGLWPEQHSQQALQLSSMQHRSDASQAAVRLHSNSWGCVTVPGCMTPEEEKPQNAHPSRRPRPPPPPHGIALEHMAWLCQGA